MYLKNSIYKETLKIPKAICQFSTRVTQLWNKYASHVREIWITNGGKSWRIIKTTKSIFVPQNKKITRIVAATGLVDSTQQSNQVKYPFMKLIKLCENSYFFGYCTRIGSGAKLTDNAYNENDTLFMGI